MRRLIIDPRAEADIRHLTRAGSRQFGVEQAAIYYDRLFNHFELLAAFPKLGRPFLHDHPCLYSFGLGVHIIIYVFDDATLTVRRVVHGRTDLTQYI